MSITLEDFRCKLIKKIAEAPSEKAIHRYIDAALKGFKVHNVNGHIVNRFVAKTILQLEASSHDQYSDQAKNNIRTALAYINYSHPTS